MLLIFLIYIVKHKNHLTKANMMVMFILGSRELTKKDPADSKGAFATLAQRPGCARGLQLAMFVVMACERAWLPRAKNSLSA